jgi:hypothetical protein
MFWASSAYAVTRARIVRVYYSLRAWGFIKLWPPITWSNCCLTVTQLTINTTRYNKMPTIYIHARTSCCTSVHAVVVSKKLLCICVRIANYIWLSILPKTSHHIFQNITSLLTIYLTQQCICVPLLGQLGKSNAEYIWRSLLIRRLKISPHHTRVCAQSF